MRNLYVLCWVLFFKQATSTSNDIDSRKFKVYVFSPVIGKVATLQLTEEDTIYQVKTEIFRQSEIPAKSQILHNQGKILENDRTVRSYNIGDQSTIEIILKYLDDTPSTRAGTPKKKKTSHHLLFKRNTLDYEGNDEDDEDLKKEDKLTIQLFDGEMLTLEGIKGEDSILSIKNRIMEAKGWPSDRLNLFYRNNPLKNDHTLNHYDIGNNDKLYMNVINRH